MSSRRENGFEEKDLSTSAGVPVGDLLVLGLDEGHVSVLSFSLSPEREQQDGEFGEVTRRAGEDRGGRRTREGEDAKENVSSSSCSLRESRVSFLGGYSARCSVLQTRKVSQEIAGLHAVGVHSLVVSSSLYEEDGDDEEESVFLRGRDEEPHGPASSSGGRSGGGGVESTQKQDEEERRRPEGKEEVTMKEKENALDAGLEEKEEDMPMVKEVDPPPCRHGYEEGDCLEDDQKEERNERKQQRRSLRLKASQEGDTGVVAVASFDEGLVHFFALPSLQPLGFVTSHEGRERAAEQRGQGKKKAEESKKKRRIDYRR